MVASSISPTARFHFSRTMKLLRTIIYATFAVSLFSLALPQAKAADVLWWGSSFCLMVSIGVWVFKSVKNKDYASQPCGIRQTDLTLPWVEIMRNIARLRLHYLYLLNVALCAFAVSRGREFWVVLIAALFPAAFLFLIGQALVSKRSFTNFGAIEREHDPRRFRVNFIILIVLYVVTSALPFVPSSVLPR